LHSFNSVTTAALLLSSFLCLGQFMT